MQSTVLTNDWRCRMSPDAQQRISSLLTQLKQHSKLSSTHNHSKSVSSSCVEIQGMPDCDELPYFNTSSRTADTPSTMRKPVVSSKHITPHTPPASSSSTSGGSDMKHSLEHPTVRSLRNSVCELMKAMAGSVSYPPAAQYITLSIFQRCGVDV